jgi:hypothetical protein
MTATGCAADCPHSVRLIRAVDHAQEAAVQLSDRQMVAKTDHLQFAKHSVAEAATRAPYDSQMT